MNSIRVAIADDHSLLREGIKLIVSGMEGITICVDARSGLDLIDQLKTTPADIVLLDIEMEDMNGKEVLEYFSTTTPKPKIIILSMYTEPKMISHMMEKGASSYLPKDVKKDELELAIRTVFEKGLYINERISRSLLLAIKSKNSKQEIDSELSTREIEVLKLICLEFTANEIAEKLFISPRTVEGHRKNLCMKLDARNTAGLVKKAMQMNLVDSKE